MVQLGAIVRSMTLRLDDNPHTGALSYSQLDEGVTPISGVAVSTLDAELLSKLLKQEKGVRVYYRTTCQMLEEKESYNVIGEITGSEFPDEIILVGGHFRFLGCRKWCTR